MAPAGVYTSQWVNHASERRLQQYRNLTLVFFQWGRWIKPSFYFPCDACIFFSHVTAASLQISSGDIHWKMCKTSTKSSCFHPSRSVNQEFEFCNKMSNVGPVSRDLKSTVITSLFYTNFKSPLGPIRHVNVKCISGSVCNTPGRYGNRPRFDLALLIITLLILSQKKIDVIRPENRFGSQI